MVHLGIGMTIGAFALGYKAFPVLPMWWRLLPLHRDALLFGWLAQMVVGMAFWLLPRYRDPARRSPWWLVRVSIACLNTGVLLAGLGPSLGGPPQLLLAGRLLEAVGLGAFLLHAWPRVRSMRFGRGE